MNTSDVIPGLGGGLFTDAAALDQLGQRMLAELLGTAPPIAVPSVTAPAAAPPILRPMPTPPNALPQTAAPYMAGALPIPEPVVPLAPGGWPSDLWNLAGEVEPWMSFDPLAGLPRAAFSPPTVPLSTPETNFYFLEQAPSPGAVPPPESGLEVGTLAGWVQTRPGLRAVPPPGSPLDVEAVRRDFPILHKPVNGKPLIWLDNGATTQKPQAVINALSRFYENDNSNVHRAAHALAARATEAYENARQVVQQFIGASLPEEIVFVRGTTEAINLAANSLGAHVLSPGDEILLTTLEHHANIVPWQMIAARTGARVVPAPIDDSGSIILEEYYRLLSRRTRIVALSQVSNVLGTVLPLEKMIGAAHETGAKVLIDGAQSIAHVPVNVTALDADLFVFSGHKIYGPTGVGVLYGKLPLLEELPPWQGGGNMIDSVSFEKTTYNKVPAKFEAGTAILAGAVGLAAALTYLRETGFERILAHEDDLLRQGTRLLAEVPGLKILGTAPEKVAVLSFSLPGVSPDEIGKALTVEGIAIRVGHHCAQPVLRRYGFTSIARASLGMYNTVGELRKLAEVLYRLRR